MWIFLRLLGVVCCDRWVLSEGHKNYSKHWCLMSSWSTFLFLTFFNSGHIIKYLWPSFEPHWMWDFPWIKLSWHLGFMWDKRGWFYWFWLFLCEGLSSFNMKGFYYSYAWSCRLCKGRTSFCMGLISGKLNGFLLVLSGGFTSLSVLLLFAWFFILFYLT